MTIAQVYNINIMHTNKHKKGKVASHKTVHKVITLSNYVSK